MLLSGFMLFQMEPCGLFHLKQRLNHPIPFYPLWDRRQIFPNLRKDVLYLFSVFFCLRHTAPSRHHHITEWFPEKGIPFDLFLPM